MAFIKAAFLRSQCLCHDPCKYPMTTCMTVMVTIVIITDLRVWEKDVQRHSHGRDMCRVVLEL
jgi:hypothetical protein